MRDFVWKVQKQATTVFHLYSTVLVLFLSLLIYLNQNQTISFSIILWLHWISLMALNASYPGKLIFLNNINLLLQINPSSSQTSILRGYQTLRE